MKSCLLIFVKKKQGLVGNAVTQIGLKKESFGFYHKMENEPAYQTVISKLRTSEKKGKYSDVSKKIQENFECSKTQYI